MNIETPINGSGATYGFPVMARDRAAYTRIPVDGCGRVKRLFNVSAGFGMLAAGLAMVPLPAPDLIVILAGLRMLAKEFRWARILLDRGSELARKTKAGLAHMKCVFFVAGGWAIKAKGPSDKGGDVNA